MDQPHEGTLVGRQFAAAVTLTGDDDHGYPLDQGIRQVECGRMGNQQGSCVDGLRLRTPPPTARELALPSCRSAWHFTYRSGRAPLREVFAGAAVKRGRRNRLLCSGGCQDPFWEGLPGWAVQTTMCWSGAVELVRVFQSRVRVQPSSTRRSVSSPSPPPCTSWSYCPSTSCTSASPAPRCPGAQAGLPRMPRSRSRPSPAPRLPRRPLSAVPAQAGETNRRAG